MLLAGVLQRFVTVGRLRLIDAHGKEHLFGAPGAEPSATIRLHDPALH